MCPSNRHRSTGIGRPAFWDRARYFNEEQRGPRVQAARLRDGSRRITHVTEVLGMEGDVIITQDLFVYEMTGEDANGRVIGRHRSTGIGRPAFWDRARYFNEEQRLAAAIDAAEIDEPMSA